MLCVYVCVYVCQSIFSNVSVTSPRSQLILQPFRRFTYITVHSTTIQSLHLRHSSFSIPFSLLLRHRLFTWLVAHVVCVCVCVCLCVCVYVCQSSFPSLHLGRSTFSNPSVALPTSQFILQPFSRFTYGTAHSLSLLSLLLRHRFLTWRAVYVIQTQTHTSRPIL